jgi:hypothetical protein
MVVADVARMGVTGGTSTATELADGGVAAAVSDCGVACADGNTGGAGDVGASGAADRATSELSVETVSFFHHAQRGPD